MSMTKHGPSIKRHNTCSILGSICHRGMKPVRPRPTEDLNKKEDMLKEDII